MANRIGLLIEKFGLDMMVFLLKSTNIALKNLYTSLLMKDEHFSLFLDILDIYMKGLYKCCTTTEIAILDPLLQCQTLLPSIK